MEELTEGRARAIALRFIQHQDILNQLHAQMEELAPYLHFATDKGTKNDGFPQAGYYCANRHHFFNPECQNVPKLVVGKNG